MDKKTKATFKYKKKKKQMKKTIHKYEWLQF